MLLFHFISIVRVIIIRAKVYSPTGRMFIYQRGGYLYINGVDIYISTGRTQGPPLRRRGIDGD